MSATTLDRPSTGRPSALRRHPLLAFFALAYGMSWIAWLPYVLSDNGIGLLHFSFPPLLGTSQLLGVLPGAYLGPVTAAFAVTALTEGRAGLRAWRRRLLNVRVRWRWWVGVLVLVPVTILVATFALPGAGSAFRLIPPLLLLGYIPMLALQIFTTALAEEPGWRDFALPRLQGIHGPVRGTVLLGLLWGGWHLPLFLTEWGGFPDASWYQPVLFVASCVPLSLVMTWVFNRSGQSVPLIMVLHAGINSTYTLLWPAFFPRIAAEGETYVVQLVATVAVTIVLLIATRGRLGLPRAADVPSPAPAHSS
jgi:membrane protease YdiL (CAAX protease family)